MAVQVVISVNSKDFGFDFIDEEIEVDAGTDNATADELKEAIRKAEWSFQGIVFDKIADTSNPVLLEPSSANSTALSIILQDLWRVLSLKTSGNFSVSGGNTVRFDTGADIFGDNPLVNMVNVLSQAATRVITGSAVTAQDKEDIKELIFNEIMEGPVAYREYIRLIWAANCADISVDGNENTIWSMDRSKPRIIANADEAGRDVTSFDGT